ncbi:MAG: hypothetical protein D8M58_04465 [Calditrichaeota bacterium]|nr:MAG: hypothetical protein DWQ03_02610 [Calditrichota bacterium]MBL1204624.1 hypothetical protein [Calditrichota bacterium]NOG44453.1 hypothetical protein [Calditrichota bacterium]
MNFAELSQKKIFKFWYPLALTWLMMAFEGPFLAAIIARLPEAKFNLAAYGVAYSFALLSEAPVIMMMAASTSLVKNSQSYFKLRNFNNLLIIFVTVILAIGLIPQIFNFITGTLINLPVNVGELTRYSLLFLIPWPGAIAYRRFLQGILIANNKTKLVSYGTIIRLLVMAGAAYGLFKFVTISGAYIGAISLSAGVVAEMIASHLMCRSILKKLKSQSFDKTSNDNLSYKKIFNFYFPLALATFIGLGAHPLITFLVGHSKMSLESLAVLPVINSLVFIFRSIGLSYQEVGIALIGEDKKGYRPLKKFATKLAFFNILVLGVIAFTSLADIWFISVSGLSKLLAEIAILPTQILIVIPALSVLISFQRAIQVAYKNTAPISKATAAEVVVIVMALFTLISLFDMIGVTAAAIALVLGRITSNSYLFFENKKHTN